MTQSDTPIHGERAVYIAEVATEALWECYLLSGADVSEYGYETRTPEGRRACYEEWLRRGTTTEVVAAVRELREEHDRAWKGDDE